MSFLKLNPTRLIGTSCNSEVISNLGGVPG